MPSPAAVLTAGAVKLKTPKQVILPTSTQAIRLSPNHSLTGMAKTWRAVRAVIWYKLFPRASIWNIFPILNDMGISFRPERFKSSLI
jgi:hypothetical protein